MNRDRLVLFILLCCAGGSFGIVIYSLFGPDATGQWTLTSASSMVLGASLSLIAFSQLRNMKAKQQQSKFGEPFSRQRR